MKPTLFLLGPSDIEGQSITRVDAQEGGRVRGSANWSGIMPIQPFIWNDASLKAKSTFALIGIQSINVPENARLNLFNMVGDADASSATLKTIQAMENDIKPLRCFNQVSNVLKTSRDRLPNTLANIPGCRLAHVTTCNSVSFVDLEKACDMLGQWPLIIRASGYHGGENMLLLKNISELKAIKDTAWLYTGVLLIEYIDYSKDDMLYEKTRVIIVDGTPYPRHSIISDQRFIHSANRSDLMDLDDELCKKEEQYLAYLRYTGLKKYGDIFNTIYQRIGLDVFGVDFALVDGEIVIFEANACMDFLSQDFGKDGRYRYLENYISALKRAVKKMLMTA